MRSKDNRTVQRVSDNVNLTRVFERDSALFPWLSVFPSNIMLSERVGLIV